MLHLVPIRMLLTAFAVVAIAAYALSLQAGLVSNATWLEVAAGIFKIATPAVLGSMIAVLAIWRWSPGFIQKLIFPYLGGEWSGEIEFSGGNGKIEQRPADLVVTQTLTSIRFALSTVESTSETLVVYARKVAVVPDLVKLVYIYEVERREGLPGAGDRYRGCAFIDVSLTKPHRMTGTYMAGSSRAGAIRMTLSRRTAWWKLWR